jgi:hypothetical protein
LEEDGLNRRMLSKGNQAHSQARGGPGGHAFKSSRVFEGAAKLNQLAGDNGLRLSGEMPLSSLVPLVRAIVCEPLAPFLGVVEFRVTAQDFREQQCA